MNLLDETHDPALTSWVDSANAENNGFPVQNLPFAIFRHTDDADDAFRAGVALGDQILDLGALAALQPWSGLARDALSACRHDSLNPLMALTRAHWSALRRELSRALRLGSPLQDRLRPLLIAQRDARYRLPARIGDYTDFYISIHHATAVGRQFRPDNPLLPNYKWVPIGYHGRASSIGVSGQRFPRPVGQKLPAQEGAAPGFGPCERLDYELELGVLIGTGNLQGKPVGMDRAEDHVFGLCILNDWSARDLQAWEYQPLGPFLAKNFASTISPWVVTLDALAPFRTRFQRNPDDPQPLPYLSSLHNQDAGAFDIELSAWLTTQASRKAGLAP